MQEISASRYDRRLRVQRELDALGATVERITHGWRITHRDQHWMLADLADLSRADMDYIESRSH